jgi:hypothetical protein
LTDQPANCKQFFTVLKVEFISLGILIAIGGAVAVLFVALGIFFVIGVFSGCLKFKIWPG